ncbi:hypothetical protein L6452_31526 [Arctium lappa]|uniref:Uncharacterized protein n=1 Tax=Arctium lappa TaxID=4217 RepID=A0ACB8Z196_ARCLA|nr:hypothetical protein L6452_31526 [Arctium lappa]
MDTKRSPLMAFKLVLTFFTTILTFYSATATELDTYIVHLNPANGQSFDHPEARETWYRSFLPPTATPASTEKHPTVVFAYHNVLTGFAAKMSAEQAKAMETMEGFISARPQRVYSTQTTHTPNFLGLHQNLGFWGGSNYGKGIIIGILDTGTTPGHPSFNDEGVLPPPSKWKGKCEVAGCNNKLIGLRNLTGVSEERFDEDGHGTHTSSTAAGSFVDYANVFGNAEGTAAGMAPLAHVAMYKVCSLEDCEESAILAGMDAAVEDGVDVLSLSLGGESLPFYQDGIAVGAFTAIQKGIFVACSAGNSGPFNSSLSNEAPWILTVGASTMDRKISAAVSLGNNDSLDGESLFQPKDFPKTLLPLVYPGSNGVQNTTWCAEGSLDDIDVKGKAVLCDRGGDVARIVKGQTVKDAGGVAMILANEATEGSSTIADAHVLPASHISYKDGVAIKAYINSTTSPLATLIFRGTVIGVESAPEVTSFSSRGPNLASPGILKPDIIGPGVSVLAAWPVSIENNTQMSTTFNMMSGTSMSCPHLAGIAALLKAAHPGWSPAAIKSAIMTTADQVSLNGRPIEDERKLPADIFAVGSGHVNPSKANDPGLVFDIQPDDYIPYLCGLGYTSQQVGIIATKTVSCSETIPEGQLNYPSYVITIARGQNKTYTRTVTNVGEAKSTYTISVTNVHLPPGIILEIRSPALKFTAVNQKITYDLTFVRDSKVEMNVRYAEGSMAWAYGKYLVQTPFSFVFV